MEINIYSIIYMDYYKKYLKYKKKYLQLKKQIGGAFVFNHDNINKKINVINNVNNNQLWLQYDTRNFARVLEPVKAIFIFNDTHYNIHLDEQYNPINIDHFINNILLTRELKELIIFMDERVSALLSDNNKAVHAMQRLKSIIDRL